MSEKSPTFEVRMTVLCCPLCNGEKLRPTGSHDNGDGSRTKHYICLACKSPFKLAVEYVTPHFHLLDEPVSGPRRVPP